MITINPVNRNQFVNFIQSSTSEMHKDAQKQRLNKILSKIEK